MNPINEAFNVLRSQTRATLAYLIVGGWILGVLAVVGRYVFDGTPGEAAALLTPLKEVVVVVIGFYYLTQGVHKALNGGGRGERSTV